MAEYFRLLASHSASNRLAIVDPTPSPSSPSRQYTYTQLLQHVTVFREHLLAAAHRTQKCLEGARIGLMVPPGVDFVAALLCIWSVKAIVGKASITQHRLHQASGNQLKAASCSSDMSITSIAGNHLHSDRLWSGLHFLSSRLPIQNQPIVGGQDRHRRDHDQPESKAEKGNTADPILWLAQKY